MTAPGGAGRSVSLPLAEAISIPVQCRGAKSFADDLGVSRGVVLSRAATILRSIETKPCDWKICPPQKGESVPVRRRGAGGTAGPGARRDLSLSRDRSLSLAGHGAPRTDRVLGSSGTLSLCGLPVFTRSTTIE